MTKKMGKEDVGNLVEGNREESKDEDDEERAIENKKSSFLSQPCYSSAIV